MAPLCSGRLPLRRLSRRLSSPTPFPRPPLPPSPNYTSTAASPSGRNNLSPLLLLLISPCSNIASRRGSGRARRSLSFCTRSLGIDEPTDSPADFSAPYLSVRIRCKRQDADSLSEALLCFGASSVTVDDVADSGSLDEICMTSIFADGEDVGACVSNAASSIGLSYVPSHETSVGEQCDWVANVQEMYHPTEITDGLWVVPKWRNPPDSQAMNIIINPGLAFGTGEHPKTKLCLLLLRGIIKGGERFFDYGTGSGVLGIAALKMGTALSTAIDIDPQAASSARENISLNGIDSNKMPVYLVSTKACSSYPHVNAKSAEQPAINLELESFRGRYDIVIANILRNPLIELVEDIVSYAKPNGIVGVSGILSEQVPKVEEVYSRFLDNVSVSEMEDWACLYGTKKRL